jgi:CheY-like chemotaxis protein
MRLRIVVFDADSEIRKLLSEQLSAKGHDVQTFPDPTACPVFNIGNCFCPSETPCADLLIMEQDLPKMKGLDFLATQVKRGCKAPAENKLLISDTLTPLQRKALNVLGVESLMKPFVLSDILSWVSRCEARIAKAQQPKNTLLPGTRTSVV